MENRMHAGTLPWYRTGWAILGASLVFPPLGLVLLWTKPGWSAGRVVLRLLATVPIAILGLAHLFMVYGMRAEMDGSGMPSIFTFRKKTKDVEDLEKQRAAQKAQAPPPAPVSLQAAAERQEPAADGGGRDAAKEGADKSKPRSAPAVPAYWTEFRGPNRDGIYAERPLLEAWPAGGLKPLWRQPAGGGYASFAVAGGVAFTIEQRRASEVVAAYDLLTGREMWTDSWPANFQESMGGDGPRSTPTWHEGRLYALGAEGEFRCLEAATGKVLWRTNILQDAGAANLMWGMAASPLIVDEKVIVLPGGPNASAVAYHKLTGKPVWKSQSDKQAYTSPMVVTLAGQRQLLVVSASRVMGLTVEDGKLLWEFPWTTEYDINASQPILLDGDHFFISAGYGHGAALVKVTRDGEKFRAEPVWKNIEMKNRFSSAVLRDGAIYGFDEGIFACIDAKTGQRRWKGGRYGYGQVLLSGDRLIVLTEQGYLALVRATPERFEELARFSAIEGKTWNVPAISDGILLVRNAREMAAFRIAR
jgi:outer membrane protein assembly factor BamB